jgi:hypothetical protein
MRDFRVVHDKSITTEYLATLSQILQRVPVFVKRKAADLVIATFTISLIKYFSC